MAARGKSFAAALEGRLDSGDRPTDAELLRSLRSPACPGSLVERLASCRWLLHSRRVLPLVVRHPSCPRPFAWEALPHLGWHDLLGVAAYPRTPPPVRRQAERRLLDRLPQMTAGERTALARLAPRAVLAGLLDVGDVPCVQALLDNPQFTENEAVRLVRTNRKGECVLAAVRHPRWGKCIAVLRAAVRCRNLPVGVLLGLVVTLPSAELEQLARSSEVPTSVRTAATTLLRRREGGATSP